jgi:ribonuclease HII
MIGIDEVGRGCWAGPLLVVAARQTGKIPEGLTDSKQLSKSQRESIFNLLIANYQFGEGWVNANKIDEIGLTEAIKLGIVRSLFNINARLDEDIILDGKVNYCDPKFKNAVSVVAADLNYSSVSAASVYAKVLRDRFMTKLSDEYSGYGFENHVGYGTKTHRTALEKHGVIKGIHRLSYKPVKSISGD